MSSKTIRVKPIEQHLRKRREMERAMRVDRPKVIVALGPDLRILAVGLDRERLSRFLEESGIADRELVDVDVVV